MTSPSSELKPLHECRLYTFVDTAYLRGRDPVDLARCLVEGGADLVQWRAKTWEHDRSRDTALRISEVLRGSGVWFVVNDHPEIAIASRSPLLHLGQEDFFEAGYRHVRELHLGAAGPGVGLSSHEPEQARRATEAGAAYIAVGPIFATPTKPGRPGVTLDYVRWAATHVSVPWFAIGGIHPANLDDVMNAGASRICVVSAILNADDPAEATRQFKRRVSAR